MRSQARPLRLPRRTFRRLRPVFRSRLLRDPGAARMMALAVDAVDERDGPGADRLLSVGPGEAAREQVSAASGRLKCARIGQVARRIDRVLERERSKVDRTD